MAAEAEIQEFLQKAGEKAGAAYHAVMKDGSVGAIGREAVKDVRNTIHEFFFGRGEHGAEPGAPLNPLFHDIVEARAGHEAAAVSPPPSPADLVDSTAAQPHADAPQVSPADMVERPQESKHGVSPAGMDLPADVRAEVKAAGADVGASIKDSQAEVGREQLGQLPTQDPPRQRLKL